MALIDTIKKHCPYCHLEGTIKQFIGWEEGDKKAFQGQTDDGYLIILCPRCRKKIRYDIQINKFLTFSGEKAVAQVKPRRLWPFLTGLVSLPASLYLILTQSSWWSRLIGIFLLVCGWLALKKTFQNSEKPFASKSFRRRPLNNAKRDVNRGL
jgi:hypothetical protein